MLESNITPKHSELKHQNVPGNSDVSISFSDLTSITPTSFLSSAVESDCRHAVIVKIIIRAKASIRNIFFLISFFSFSYFEFLSWFLPIIFYD